MRPVFLPLSALLVACPSGGDKDGGQTNTTTDERGFEDFVDTTAVYTGDTTCFTGTLASETAPEATCQVTTTVNGIATNFNEDMEGPEVYDATISLWSTDDITGSPTDVVVADPDTGEFTADLLSCSPFGYGVTTPYGYTVPTYEIHQVLGYGETSVEVNSVSDGTSTLIPSLIGVDWDVTTGIIAGAAYDCNEDPIMNAQVFLHDADGNVPATGDVFYFDSGLPTDRERRNSTNDDGLWVAINVPAGTWIVELYGYDGADYVMLGSTSIQISAGSVNISNIYTGVSDGIHYPSNCSDVCGE